MLSVVAWHGLTAFIHTGTWRDIATVLLTLVLLAAFWLLHHAD